MVALSEAVMATAATVAYDNTTSITATLGDPVPLDGGYISVPVTFAENVIVPSKTVFAVNPPTGETLLAEIEYVLLGENMAYELLFSMPPDRREGQFEISANGDVWKIATKLWKPVAMATPKVVNYILDVPRIVNMRMPTNGVYDLEGPVDILVEYNTTVTGWNLNNTITRDSTTPSFAIFEIDGAELGTPTPYKWVGTDDPDFEAIYPLLPNERRENGTYNTEANDTALANLGWQKLAAPPPGDPTPNMNGFDEDGQWHGEEGKFYLIRFSDPQVLGFFELREILGHVRGPGPISSNL